MSQNVILAPAAPSGTGVQRPWKALDTLQGKVVAFIDNSKPNFIHLAADLGELLKQTENNSAANAALAYQPRMMQVGIKFTF